MKMKNVISLLCQLKCFAHCQLRKLSTWKSINTQSTLIANVADREQQRYGKTAVVTSICFDSYFLIFLHKMFLMKN